MPFGDVSTRSCNAWPVTRWGSMHNRSGKACVPPHNTAGPFSAHTLGPARYASAITQFQLGPSQASPALHTRGRPFTRLITAESLHVHTTSAIAPVNETTTHVDLARIPHRKTRLSSLTSPQFFLQSSAHMHTCTHIRSTPTSGCAPTTPHTHSELMARCCTSACDAHNQLRPAAARTHRTRAGSTP